MSFVAGNGNPPEFACSSTVGRRRKHGGNRDVAVVERHTAEHSSTSSTPPASGDERAARRTACAQQRSLTVSQKITASFHQVLTYQPAYRFWTFQWIEMSIYLVFAIAAGCLQLLVGAAPDRLEGAHPVVAGVMGHFGEAECLEQGWEVHPKRPRYPLRSPYQPPTGFDRRPSPRLDGAVGGRLVLVGRAEGDPVALGDAATRAGPRSPTGDTSTSWIRRRTPTPGDRRLGRGTSSTSTTPAGSSAPTGRSSFLRSRSLLPNCW